MTLHARAFDLPRPSDVESEQQLLGELLLNNAAAERLVGLLAAQHFAEPLHQRIYDAIERAVNGPSISRRASICCSSTSCVRRAAPADAWRLWKKFGTTILIRGVIWSMFT